MIKCAIFDMDGTLADTLPLCIESFRRSIEKLSGKILTDREIIETFGPSEEGVVKKLLPGNYKEGLELYLQYYKELHGIMCPRPFDGIIPLLEWLKSQNISAAIVTGKGGKSLAVSLKVLRLEKYFCRTEYGDESGTDKCEFIGKIMKRLALDKRETVYVGDSVSDIISSRKAGIRAVAAAWAETADKERLKAASPDYFAESVAELKDAIEKMNG